MRISIICTTYNIIAIKTLYLPNLTASYLCTAFLLSLHSSFTTFAFFTSNFLSMFHFFFLFHFSFSFLSFFYLIFHCFFSFLHYYCIYRFFFFCMLYYFIIILSLLLILASVPVATQDRLGTPGLRGFDTILYLAIISSMLFLYLTFT